VDGKHRKIDAYGDCVLSQEFIHGLGVVQGYGCVSHVMGQPPLPEVVDAVN
jgi:hypothetical protein